VQWSQSRLNSPTCRRAAAVWPGRCYLPDAHAVGVVLLLCEDCNIGCFSGPSVATGILTVWYYCANVHVT